MSKTHLHDQSNKFFIFVLYSYGYIKSSLCGYVPSAAAPQGELLCSLFKIPALYCVTPVHLKNPILRLPFHGKDNPGLSQETLYLLYFCSLFSNSYLRAPSCTIKREEYNITKISMPLIFSLSWPQLNLKEAHHIHAQT